MPYCGGPILQSAAQLVVVVIIIAIITILYYSYINQSVNSNRTDVLHIHSARSRYSSYKPIYVPLHGNKM